MDENLNLNKNQKIEEALKEFESQQGKKEISPSFETVDVLKTQKIEIPQNSELPKMVQFVIKHSGGMIKDQKQAEYVLLVLTIFMFLLSFYFFFKDSFSKNNLPGEIIPDQSQFIQ